MMMNSPMSSLLVLFYLFSSLVFSANSNSITLSLTPTAVLQPSSTNNNLRQRISYHAAACSARAHYLKNSTANVSVFARGYGAYSMTLSIGTPPQLLKLILDTGSSFVWFPCTLKEKYFCISCYLPGVDPKNIPTFKPNSSSSSKNITCENPQCKWIFPDHHCSKLLCPEYIFRYRSGNTTGQLLSESLTFPGISLHNFLVGCSVSSALVTADGIVGFGRGLGSLPSQMGLKSFSYCLVAHKFDDNRTMSSDLVLNMGSAAAGKGSGPIQYTPFSKNPNVRSHRGYLQFYYVSLQKIYVGSVDVKVPCEYLTPDANGNGGTMVDSGTTFTSMEEPVFELVAQEFVKQLGKDYNRSREIEIDYDLGLCFNLVSGKKPSNLPQLSFHFKGGVIMDLPLENYFLFLNSSVICTSMLMNNGTTGGGIGPGPVIILGNYQQQNFYMEFDLKNNRLGFRKQVCKRG